MTIEDPIEKRMPGVNQTQVDSRSDMGFSEGLKAMLRQDPDVIMIGEIRDEETAQIGIRAAMTGVLVFSTIHGSDCASTIGNLYNFGIPGYQLSNSLLAIVSQRLIRKICPYCRVTCAGRRQGAPRRSSSTPRSTSDLVMHRGLGCPACFQTGYLGRTGIFEIMEVSEELRELIFQQIPKDVLRRMAIDLGLQTLKQARSIRSWKARPPSRRPIASSRCDRPPAAGCRGSAESESKPARRSAMRPGWKSLVGATLLAPGLLIVDPGPAARASATSRAGSAGSSASAAVGSIDARGAGAARRPRRPSVPSAGSPRTLTAMPAVRAPAPPPAAPAGDAPRIVPSRASRGPSPSPTRSSPGSRSTVPTTATSSACSSRSSPTAPSSTARGSTTSARTPSSRSSTPSRRATSIALRGHCGAPATDYVESVHVIVYERSLGRLRANAFSYSGNPQGATTPSATSTPPSTTSRPRSPGRCPPGRPRGTPAAAQPAPLTATPGRSAPARHPPDGSELIGWTKVRRPSRARREWQRPADWLE